MRRNKSASKQKPKLEFIRALQKLGYGRIVGVDEVGRGALAGPVVVAAVELDFDVIGVNDSKQLSLSKRNRLAAEIHLRARQLAIGQASNQEIDQLGLSAALALAYKRALKEIEADLILTDAYIVEGYKNQLKAVRGDLLLYPVAAASIVAKVYRDELMKKLHNDFPDYFWDKNVGYGTKKHLDAIRERGVSPLHRQCFIRG